MAPLQLLEQSQEDALHASRLLNVEEKPFRRLSKRLLSAEATISVPQPNISSPAESSEADATEKNLKRKRWHEDSSLDFEAFESNSIRVQLLANSNGRERKRYASEKIRIMETAHDVRSHNAQLNQYLEDAQNLLAVRKSYDELAEKITAKPSLRQRDDQHTQLEKLNGEISDLERQNANYKDTFLSRGQQFQKILDEGRNILRLIRDEKEEADRKEGMDQMDDGEDGEMSLAKGTASGAQTPKVGEGSGTPSAQNVETLRDEQPEKANRSSEGAAESSERSQMVHSVTHETQNNESHERSDVEETQELVQGSEEAEEGEEVEDSGPDISQDVDVT